jgi:hypothetical protein
MKTVIPTLFAVALLALTMPGTARGEHFEIQLTVSSSTERQTSTSDTNTPQKPQGNDPRPVVHAKVGEEIVLQYFVSSNFPHNAIKQVTILHYIVPEDKAAQDTVPGIENAVIEGHFVMDFQPKTSKVGIRQRLKIEKKGTYLARVESQNSDSDHEHFSAQDLVVE